jgi:hypothetical protein
VHQHRYILQNRVDARVVLRDEPESKNEVKALRVNAIVASTDEEPLSTPGRH